MAAPKGNKFWEARSSHGRKPKFSDANQLWDACCEYFHWVEENPLYEAKPFHYQGQVIIEQIPKMRAMTIASMCLFLDITHETWITYRKNKDFSEVCASAEQIIYSQKFTGASADLLNAAIIARDLGLADKTEITGKDGGAIQTEDVSDKEFARRMAYLLEKGARDASKQEG